MTNYQEELELLRKYIDEIDSSLISVLAKRLEVVKAIGKLKKEQNTNVIDMKRWEKVIEKVTQKAKEKGLKEEYVIEIYNILHKYAQELENTIVAEK